MWCWSAAAHARPRPSTATGRGSSGPVARSNGAAASSAACWNSRNSCSLPPAWRRSRSARAKPISAAAMRCTGSPSTSTKVVRRASWRGHDAVQRAPAGHPVEASLQAQRGRHVVGRAGGVVQLVEEPQALLRERQRQGRVAVGQADLGQLGAPRPRRGGGERLQGRGGEQIAQADFDAKRLAQARHQPHRQQRVAAQLEEVVVPADPLEAEQLAPDGGERLFEPAFRRVVFAGGQGGAVGRRQGLAIELAVGGQRQRVEHARTPPAPCSRAGAAASARAASPPRSRVRSAPPGRRPGACRQVVLARQHHRFAHVGAGQQPRLDLAQLDAEAADLHLVVVAAEVLDAAVGQPARQIAGLVQARAGHSLNGSATKRSAVSSARFR